MTSTWNRTSIAFRRFVDERHPPVIMQVVPNLNSGGVEQGVIDVNTAIIAAGGHSIVVSNGGLRVHEITKAGGTHITLPVHSKNPLTMSRNVKRLREVINEMNVDLVHACSRAPAWSAVRAVKGTRASYVTSCHAAHKVGGVLKRLYNSSITKGERVITVSHFLADYLEKNYKIDSNLIRVIHRGVGVERFHPNAVTPDRLVEITKKMRIPEGASVVLLPGRLSRIKGHMFLLDAIELLAREDIFCLFLGSDIGNESYRKELETYIANKGLEGKVRIVTDCKDMPAAYMIATVVTAPSLVPEGFGRIAVEAQAMGRPIIATSHGGSQETVLPGQTGWLVENGNIQQLAGALQEALSLDPRQRSGLATQAMSHVLENFTNEQMCEGTLDVYAELLDQNYQISLPNQTAQEMENAA